MTRAVCSSTLFQGGIVAVGFLILWLVDVHRKAASAATREALGEITGCGSLRRPQHSSAVKSRAKNLGAHTGSGSFSINRSAALGAK